MSNMIRIGINTFELQNIWIRLDTLHSNAISRKHNLTWIRKLFSSHHCEISPFAGSPRFAWTPVAETRICNELFFAFTITQSQVSSYMLPQPQSSLCSLRCRRWSWAPTPSWPTVVSCLASAPPKWLSSPRRPTSPSSSAAKRTSFRSECRQTPLCSMNWVSHGARVG